MYRTDLRTAMMDLTEKTENKLEAEPSLHNSQNVGCSGRPASLPTFMQTDQKAGTQAEARDWCSLNGRTAAAATVAAQYLSTASPSSSAKHELTDTSLWYREIFKKMHKIPEKGLLHVTSIFFLKKHFQCCRCVSF